AFQVTADVPEIYMQEFWATAKLYHTSIRFKIDTKKSILDLEAFREMLHISPRIPSQSFAELPTEEEILEFLSDQQVPDGQNLWRDSASSTTPPTPTPTTTVVSAPRLSATAKGKQPSRATTPTEPTDVERTEAEQLKIVLKRSRQEKHISQQCGSGTDEGTSSRPGEELEKDDDEDTESGKGGDDVNESEGESNKEETRQEEEESFDPIPRTSKDSEEESDDEEDQELSLSEEARIQEEEEADKLYRDVNINQGRGLQVTQNVEDAHVTLTRDFSSFIMNRLNVDTLTPKLLAGPTYELMRGSCTSLTELEYHLEEVYKATTDQLDWVNPKATDRLQQTRPLGSFSLGAETSAVLWDVHQEHFHQEASERPSTGSGKLPEEAQPYEA
nr:hypothetical protein [Tanacetum cinerariifolium]